jgi:tripartite-type tricarboxylate transporter receptor subunit TctC
MISMLAAGAVSAQEYPIRPVRIVTNAAGGGGDFISRIIAQGIAGPLGQAVVVDNRASSVIATIVAKAAPDGYTVLTCPDSLWTAPLLEKISYDPVRDFAPISLLTRAPNILVVVPSLPVKSVRELIAMAKAKPGELNYATGSSGGSNHLAAELFNTMAGISMTRVNYKGSGPGMAALISGEVQVMFPNAAAGAPHIKSGKLRALAVGSAQPSALVPGLPTIAASGLPGYESASTVGLFAPAGTPAAVIRRLNQEIVRLIYVAETKERLFAVGSESVGSSPAELGATVKSEMMRLGKLIKDARIRMD